MTDISIQFPWWFDVLIVLTWAFWPLTIAAVGAAVWLCLARTSRAARIVAVIIAVPWLVSAGMNLWLHIDATRSHAAGVAYDHAHSKTLATDSVVGGMQLPAGTVVTTDEKFAISSLELAKPTVLFGVPLKGTVTLSDAKLDGSETLQHDATIDGLICSAGDGVSYRLYGVTWYEGTDVRGSDDDLTFTIGARPSSLHVLGSSLTQGTMVNYVKGVIAMVTPITPLSYHGCKITAIERRGSVTRATSMAPVRCRRFRTVA